MRSTACSDQQIEFWLTTSRGAAWIATPPDLHNLAGYGPRIAEAWHVDRMCADSAAYDDSDLFGLRRDRQHGIRSYLAELGAPGILRPGEIPRRHATGPHLGLLPQRALQLHLAEAPLSNDVGVLG